MVVMVIRGSGDSPDYGRYYHHSSGGGCDGLHSTPGAGDSDSPNDPYGGSSDNSSFSKFGRRCRHY